MHIYTLYINTNYTPAEYCGSMRNWVYQGAVAFSRNSPVSHQEMDEIETALGRHGFNPDNFCSPKYVGCTNVNVEFQKPPIYFLVFRRQNGVFFKYILCLNYVLPLVLKSSEKKGSNYSPTLRKPLKPLRAFHTRFIVKEN